MSKHNKTEKPENENIGEETNKKTCENQSENKQKDVSAEKHENQQDKHFEKEEKEEEKKAEKKEEKPSKEQEYLLMAQKIQAEFENYRKRTLKAEADARKDGIIEAVKKFLPVIDAFDMAQKQTTNEEYLKVNAMIVNQLNKALDDLGVKKIDAKGKKFDHNYHNAIMVSKVDDVESGIVLEVFQEGYMLGDKVIRYSVVKVSE